MFITTILVALGVTTRCHKRSRDALAGDSCSEQANDYRLRYLSRYLMNDSILRKPRFAEFASAALLKDVASRYEVAVVICD